MDDDFLRRMFDQAPKARTPVQKLVQRAAAELNKLNSLIPAVFIDGRPEVAAVVLEEAELIAATAARIYREAARLVAEDPRAALGPVAAAAGKSEGPG